jgi:Outer membrane protein beta-barrel domain
MQLKYILSSLLIIILLCPAGHKVLSQSNEIKGNSKAHNSQWHCYFGVEGGLNQISTLRFGEKSKYAQFGALAEFYLTRNLAICARIKYFDTGVSFSQKALSGWFGYDAHSGIFRGKVISFPVNLKREYKISSKIRGYFKFGWARNREIKSDYEFTPNLRTDYSKLYINFNIGMGFSYFIHTNLAIYLDLENYYFGGAKGHSSGLIFSNNYYVGNNQISLGVKCSLGLMK